MLFSVSDQYPLLVRLITQFFSRLLRLASLLIALLFSLLLLLALFGQAIRDPNATLAYLMYLPLPLIALFAIVFDLLRFGHALPRRFALSSLALIGLFVSYATMVGFSRPQAIDPNAQQLRIMQWNVRWGGISKYGGWNSIVNEIPQHQPDIVVLNELPYRKPLQKLLDALGDTTGEEWSVVSYKKYEQYDFVGILSPWPMQLVEKTVLRDMDMLHVRVDHPQKTMHFVLVDGLSNRRLSRIPRMVALRQYLADAGVEVDVIAGDFNTIGRSRGFDLLREIDYQLAAEQAGVWRGSWFTREFFDILWWLPLFDIDHVWLAASYQVTGAHFFTNYSTDHRGQIVDLQWLPDSNENSFDCETECDEHASN